MENKGSELSPSNSSSGVTSCVQKKIDALRAGFEYVRPWGEDKFSPAFTDVSDHHTQMSCGGWRGCPDPNLDFMCARGPQ
jgi:hypothetical protein